MSDAEGAIVGGLLMLTSVETLRDASRLLDVLSLEPQDFASPEMAGYFAAIEARLREGRPSRPADVAAAVAAAMGRKPEVVERRLVGLRVGAHRGEEVFRDLATQIRSASMQRRLKEFYRTRADAVAEPGEELRAIEAFTKNLAVRNGGTRLGDEDVIALCDQLEAAQLGNGANVTPTGIDALDAVVGGFRPTLNIIGGLPSIGKTALVATVIENLILRGVKVGVFALEDGTIGITRRILARRAGIPFGDLGARRLTPHELESFQDAAGIWHPLAQQMLKFDGEACTPKRLVDMARDWIVNRGCRIVFVDHLGELEPDEVGSRHEEAHWRIVRRMLAELRLIATRYGVPVVACAHFNREAARSGAAPGLHQFAESEYIGRMSRVALGLWRDAEEDTDSIRCTVLKNMFGPRDVTVDLARLTSSGMLFSDDVHREQMARFATPRRA